METELTIPGKALSLISNKFQVSRRPKFKQVLLDNARGSFLLADFYSKEFKPERAIAWWISTTLLAGQAFVCIAICNGARMHSIIANLPFNRSVKAGRLGRRVLENRHLKKLIQPFLGPVHFSVSSIILSLLYVAFFSLSFLSLIFSELISDFRSSILTFLSILPSCIFLLLSIIVFSYLLFSLLIPLLKSLPFSFTASVLSFFTGYIQTFPGSNTTRNPSPRSGMAHPQQSPSAPPRFIIQTK